MSDLISQIEDQIGPRTLLPLRIVNSVKLRGWSVTVPDTRIHINISCSAANDAGSFPLGTDPREVKATIFAFPGEFDKTWATQPTPSTPIPDVEAEAWVRVIFGEQLADFAYQRRAVSTPHNRLSTSTRRFSLPSSTAAVAPSWRPTTSDGVGANPSHANSSPPSTLACDVSSLSAVRTPTPR